MTDEPTTSARRERRQRRQQRRPWPMVAVLLSLIIQAAGYLAITGFHLNLFGPLPPGAADKLGFAGLALSLLTMSFALVALAAGALLAAVSNIVRSPSAWQNTMLVQGLSLAVALVLYFGERPYYSYLIMLYAVGSVVYLLLPGVQAAFLPPGENRR